MKPLVRTSVEICLVFTLAMLRIWTPAGLGRKYFGYVAMAIVLAGWISRKENLRSLGLINWKLASLGLTIFAAKSIYGKHLLGHAGLTKIIIFFVAYFGWALFQQLTLNGYFSLRLKSILGNNLCAACWAGIIFMTIHIPNPLLMPVTFFGGTLSSYLFLTMRRRNLYFLAFVHAGLALLIYYASLYLGMQSLIHNFRIGPGFWEK